MDIAHAQIGINVELEKEIVIQILIVKLL